MKNDSNIIKETEWKKNGKMLEYKNKIIKIKRKKKLIKKKNIYNNNNNVEIIIKR